MSTISTDAMDQEASNEKPDHKECLRILNHVLDNEATPEEYVVFKKHLENCMPYFEIMNIDKTIRLLLKKNCKDKKLSESMKDEIRSAVFNTAG